MGLCRRSAASCIRVVVQGGIRTAATIHSVVRAQVHTNEARDALVVHSASTTISRRIISLKHENLSVGHADQSSKCPIGRHLHFQEVSHTGTQDESWTQKSYKKVAVFIGTRNTIEHLYSILGGKPWLQDVSEVSGTCFNVIHRGLWLVAALLMTRDTPPSPVLDLHWRSSDHCLQQNQWPWSNQLHRILYWQLQGLSISPS